MKYGLVVLALLVSGCATTYSGSCRGKDKTYHFQRVKVKEIGRHEIWIDYGEPNAYYFFAPKDCRLKAD
jgi:hypothetical protein